MPHDSSHPRVQSLRSDENSLPLNELMILYTILSKKVEALQSDLKQTKLTYGVAYTKLILRVKKLEHKVKTSQHKRRIQEDSEIQGRTSAHTQILIDQEETTALVEDQGSGEKSENEISTANIPVSTAGAKLCTVILEVSTAAGNLVYIRNSVEKRKDKGKAIMKEDEYVQKKSKKQLVQERLGHEEAIRLQEKSFFAANVRKNMYMYLKNHGGYKLSHFMEMSYKDVRPIFEREDISSISTRGSRRKTVAKKRIGAKLDEESSKKQKLEVDTDAEKEELREILDIVPRDDISISIESLATNYLIVDWKTHILTKNMMYYQVIRPDGSSKNYKIFSEMLDDFDRQDVIDVQERSFFAAKVRKNMYMYLKNQGGYKLSHFKEMSYKDVRPIFERVWDQNQAFVPMDSNIKKEVMKNSVARKRIGAKLNEESSKKQKLEVDNDAEKEELRAILDIVPRDDIAIIIRADGSSKNYKIFSEMLNDFDRQDVIDVQERNSVEKRKDKGKAIMKEDESVQKKSKKQLEQERLGHEEAIRLQEQFIK
nr:hypothetical protein [Tanacetum cinerariifolium]